ncbi:MAG: ACP S-malonyltransferase [Alphaproteobacteria bacterium]|nr:ACP S-malonyltransferase [Alphaproteobacteria bacterium]
MSTAFLFPGQGSQAVGMGRSLYESEPTAKNVFEEVDEALGEALSTVIFEGPEETLRLTENAQPALMATSLAAVRALEARSGRALGGEGAFVAGHSLGEYSALAAAGAISIGDAARLLRLRGRSMQTAVPVGEGAMAAVLGLDLADVEAVAAEAAGDQVCDVANDNAPGQVVVSGDKAAVERAVEIAKAKGAKRSLLLPVSAPFHCRLMAPAADAVGAALEEIAFQRPALPVITNVSAAPESDPDALKRALVEQVTARVRWRESVLALAGQGVDRLLELGSGKVLTGLAKRIDRSLSASAIGTAEDLDAHFA